MSEDSAVLASVRFAAMHAEAMARPEEAEVLWVASTWIATATAAMRVLKEDTKGLRDRLGKWEPLTANQIIHGPKPDPMDTIAKERGWPPLEPCGVMTVRFGGVEYQVKRLAAEETDEP